MSEEKSIIIISADETIEVRRWTPENGLADLQSIVGGYIETVPTELSNFLMLVNDEGKLLSLPLNVFASLLIPRTMGREDCIVGTAILMKRGREDIEPLTQAEAERWLRIIKDVTLHK